MLTLRKVTGHPQAENAYRVIFDGIEIGSIGSQIGSHNRQFWTWGIDTVLPQQRFATFGQADSIGEAMTAFSASWERFIQDPARLQAMRDARR